MILHCNAALMMNMQAIVRGASLKRPKSSVSFRPLGSGLGSIWQKNPQMAKAVTSTLLLERPPIVRIRRTKTVIFPIARRNNFMAWVYNKFYVI